MPGTSAELNLPGHWILMAQSARMLAQSARRGGLSCSAIDHFADLDTGRYAQTCRTVPMADEADDGRAWSRALDDLALPQGSAGIVYGSGLDTQPGLLARLAQRYPVFGNSPETLAPINEPRRFFRLLEELGIPFPETRFAAPEHPEGWLVKPGCGEGGKGVGFLAEIGRPAAGAYFQKYLPGPVFSALFLADGREFRVIGFNTLWADGRASEPFLFAGAINRAGLDGARRAAVEECVRRLVERVRLRGLNGLDFILDGDGGVRVLELNPRPSATMALYDADLPGGLLLAHLRACLGELPDFGEFHPRVRAFRVIPARHAILMTQRAWPPWAADLPRSGQIIGAGEPVCTVQAEGETAEAVSRLLNERVRQIGEALGELPLMRTAESVEPVPGPAGGGPVID